MCGGGLIVPELLEMVEEEEVKEPVGVAQAPQQQHHTATFIPKSAR